MASFLKKRLSISIKIHIGYSQTAMEFVWSVFKLSTESVGSRREPVANSVHTADASVRQLSRVGVGGVYWALAASSSSSMAGVCT